MNPQFPATPEEISGIQTRVAMLTNLLYVMSKPGKELPGENAWGNSMLRNLDILTQIYDTIIHRKNEVNSESEEHPNPEDCQRAMEVAKEVKANPGHSFSLQMDPNMMSVLVGALQLSTRHPYFGQTENAKQVVKAVNAMIDMVPKELFPKYRALLIEGWDNPQTPENTQI